MQAREHTLSASEVHHLGGDQPSRWCSGPLCWGPPVRSSGMQVTSHTPARSGRVPSGARTQTHTHPNSPARSGGAQPKRKPKHTQPHRKAKPGIAGYKRSAHKNTHTPQHPGQEWQGASKT